MPTSTDRRAYAHGKAGPLAEGELARARAWGEDLARKLTGPRASRGRRGAGHEQQLHLGAVVVGVDGSAGSNAALAWAVDEASRRRLPLHLVHATNTDYLVAAAMLNPATAPEALDDLVEAAREWVLTTSPGLHVTAEASTAPRPTTSCGAPMAPRGRGRRRGQRAVRGSLGRCPSRSPCTRSHRWSSSAAATPAPPVVRSSSAWTAPRSRVMFEQASLREAHLSSSTRGGSSSSTAWW